MNTSKSHPEQPVADLIASECLAVRIRLLSRTITGIYDQALRPLGLTTGQLNILVVVAMLGPVAPGEVARKLNMEKSTVSRNTERMHRNGWLTAAVDDSGRTQTLTLAPKGRQMLKKSLPLWSDAQSRATALLGQRGVKSIHRVSNALWAHLARE
jgi:DNA-binding MarR family transcriptional regulator